MSRAKLFGRLRTRRLAGCLSALVWGGALGLAAEPAMPELAALHARTSPEWLTHGVIYQIWLRSFTPEGTLGAATGRLSAVAELGATVVYLCPIMLQDDDPRPEFWSTRQKASGTCNPRNPYRIKDYNRIDPEYGTEADLRVFIATAHKLGLHVLLDLVYFHCGPTAVLMGRPGFIEHDAAGKVMTGEWHFPRLNFKSQALREYLWANMEHWVKDYGVDGFRCDVGDAVPLDFWEAARGRLAAIQPELVMLSEGQRRADQVKAFDLDYGFSWYDTTLAVFTRSQPADSLRQLWLQQQAERPRGARFIRYTENHDLVNDMQHAEVMCSVSGAHAMAVINFTIDGVPFLYNGQEIDDASPQSIYARWPIRWEAACLPKSKLVFTFHQQLCHLRHDEAALQRGEVIWLDNDQPAAVVSFLRRAGMTEILSVVNLSNHAIKTSIHLPAGSGPVYHSVLSSGAQAGTTAGAATFELGGFGYFVGRK